MPHEIERKFLVRSDDWRHAADGGERYRQGYLSTDAGRVVRVRAAGTKAWLTIKGSARGIVRDEYEYAIPIADADAMLDTLCRRPIIEKVRHRVPFAGHVWEVDVFEGENAGLVIAEVELPSEETVVELPAWVGAEVSDDRRYSNAALVEHPYSEWGR